MFLVSSFVVPDDKLIVTMSISFQWLNNDSFRSIKKMKLSYMEEFENLYQNSKMKIVVCTSVLIEWIFMGKTHLIKSFMLKLWCFLYTTILKIILSLGLIHFVHLKHKYLSYFNDTLQYKNTCWIVILNLQMIILAPVGNYYIIILPLKFLYLYR